MPSQGDLMGMVSGFLHGFAGAMQQKENQERELLVGAIDAAVRNGTPETLGLLNPEKLTKFGMDQLLPAYAQIATTVQQQKKMEQRKLEAQTRLDESQARVGEGTEEAKINTAKFQEERAGQQVKGGAIELREAEANEEILKDNPSLRMLPYDKQKMEIKNVQSQITERAARTDIAYKELSAQNAVRGAQIGEISSRRLIQNMQADYLKGLPEEERNATLQQMLTPGQEAAFDRDANQLRQRADSANKTWQVVMENIKKRAEKSGDKVFEYQSKEAADADASALNKAAMDINMLNETSQKKFKGKFFEDAPLHEVIKIPGAVYGESYKIVLKEPALIEDIKSLGIDPSLFRKQKGKKIEVKREESLGGSKAAVDPSKERPRRGPVKEVK